MATELIEIEPFPQPADVSASVIFLHGIWGSAETSWSIDPSQDEALWPKWIAKTYPKVKVFSVNYESSVARDGMRIEQRAANLLSMILTRQEFTSRPYVLICHSMGGLIAKQLLIDAEAQGQTAIVNNHVGTVFYSTPHRGSRQAERLNNFVPGVWMTKPLRDLALNNSYVEFLFRSYRQYVGRNGQAKHKNFHETKSTLAFRIVEELSSDDGLSQGESVPLDYDHIKITKFYGTSDIRFVQVTQFLEEILEPFGITRADQTFSIQIELKQKTDNFFHYLACYATNILALFVPWVFLIVAPIVARGNVSDLPGFLGENLSIPLTFFVICSIVALPLTYGMRTRNMAMQALVCFSLSGILAFAMRVLGAVI